MTAEEIHAAPRPRLAALRREAQAEQMAIASARLVGQSPMRVDLSIYQGDDFFLNVEVDDTVSSIDLTGYTPKAEIRAVAGGPTVIATFDAVILSPTTVGLHLPNDQSDLLTAAAAWDVQITSPTGVVTTLAYGSVIVMKQVTR
jgi:hypothetical protein